MTHHTTAAAPAAAPSAPPHSAGGYMPAFAALPVHRFGDPGTVRHQRCSGKAVGCAAGTVGVPVLCITCTRYDDHVAPRLDAPAVMYADGLFGCRYYLGSPNVIESRVLQVARLPARITTPVRTTPAATAAERRMQSRPVRAAGGGHHG